MNIQIKPVLMLLAGFSMLSIAHGRTASVLQDDITIPDTALYEELYSVDSAPAFVDPHRFAVQNPAQTQPSSAAKPARDYCPHEIGIWLSGGVNELLYTSSFGDRSAGWGGAFGLGYTWFFHRNWGLGLGAELALYRSQIRLDGLTDAYATQDQDGDEIIYSAKINRYKENQYLGNVNIPLHFIFQTKMRGQNKFYAALAFKLGLPVWSKYCSRDSEFSTFGYYPGQNEILGYQNGHYVDYPDLGYGSFKGENSHGKIPFDLSYIGNFETGFKWRLSPGRDLYTGVYAEYAFNDVVKGAPGDRFVSYNAESPSDFSTQGILTSEYRRYGAQKSFTDKVSLLGVGLKLKLGLSAGCSAQLDAERAAKDAAKAAEKQARKAEKRQERMEDLEYLQAQHQALGGGSRGNGAPADSDAARYYADAARYMADAAKSSAEQAKIEADRAREERDAYLREARLRRVAFEREVVRPNSGLNDVDNYNLAIVTLNAIQKRDLDDYVELLKSDGHMTARITGHTCDIGSEGLNLRIGQERADLAKDYMVENGIAPARVETFSKGETQPAYPNANAVNRKKNRRVEILVIR